MHRGKVFALGSQSSGTQLASQSNLVSPLFITLMLKKRERKKKEPLCIYTLYIQISEKIFYASGSMEKKCPLLSHPTAVFVCWQGE